MLGDYSKNAICICWIEMLKSPAIISNVFYPNYLSLRNVASTGLQ